MVKMGDPIWKATTIALNNLGALLELQMPVSMVKNAWQSLSEQSKTVKDVVCGTLSQTSAIGGQLCGYSGVDIWGEIEAWKSLRVFPAWQCSRVVSEQWVW
jgi:hypothetical protein